MISDPDVAALEISEMLRAEWEARAGSVVGGSAPVVVWQGQELETPPPLDFVYLRCAIDHTSSRQSSLGPTGGRLFTRNGIFVGQCFTPMSFRNYLSIARKLGKIVLDAFEGRSSPGGIWFRNCRLSEIGPQDGRYLVNIYSDFSYDEVK